MRALNFYSAVYHGILVCRDKKCTIRLGDKTGKYAEGDLVWVTYGDRYKKRRKVFTAVIDRVDVKKIEDLTERDLKGENPEMSTPQDAVELLKRIYNREVTPEDIVTVIHFSEVTGE